MKSSINLRVFCVLIRELGNRIAAFARMVPTR